MHTIATILPLSATGEMTISYVAVAQEHRRKSIGSALIRFAFAHAEGLGAKTLLTEIRETNDAARRFFAKAGFQETAVLKTAPDAIFNRGPRILAEYPIRRAT